MPTRSLRLMLMLAALVSGWAAADDMPKHLELARKLLAEVSPENNGYRHNGWVRWKGDRTLFGEVDAPEVHADCSGLVNALLERAGSKAYGALKSGRWKGYPKAENYVEEIGSGNGFLTRRTLQEVRVGDIVAARYFGAADTGHVMVVDSEPARIEPALAPVIAGTSQWQVAIIDSSGAHWKGDTRYRENGEKRDGIGRGTIRIYTDPAGTPVGWAWSMGPKSRYRDKEPLAIGTPLY